METLEKSSEKIVIVLLMYHHGSTDSGNDEITTLRQICTAWSYRWICDVRDPLMLDLIQKHFGVRMPGSRSQPLYARYVERAMKTGDVEIIQLLISTFPYRSPSSKNARQTQFWKTLSFFAGVHDKADKLTEILQGLPDIPIHDNAALVLTDLDDEPGLLPDPFMVYRGLLRGGHLISAQKTTTHKYGRFLINEATLLLQDVLASPKDSVNVSDFLESGTNVNLLKFFRCNIRADEVFKLAIKARRKDVLMLCLESLPVSNLLGQQGHSYYYNWNRASLMKLCIDKKDVEVLKMMLIRFPLDSAGYDDVFRYARSLQEDREGVKQEITQAISAHDLGFGRFCNILTCGLVLWAIAISLAR